MNVLMGVVFKITNFFSVSCPACSLHVCGHSAGGHLAACMMYTDWPKYGVASQPLSGALLLSGIYNLDPIQRSHVDRPLKLTE